MANGEEPPWRQTVSREIDWSRIRGVPDDDDPPDRAELVAEVAWLRRELAGLHTQPERQEGPPALLVGEVRRLAASVEAMKASLPALLATIPEAAEALGVSVSTVRRGIKDGSIPYRRIGRSVRVDLSACKGLDADDVARLARAARSGR
jgi:excisionase family DNA binding protein